MSHTMSVGIDDIRSAAARLQPYLTQTPLLRSPILDQRTGGTVLLKAECLQQTGSFKIRGALNRILQLTEDERQAGVVAYSSGNHAQGIALAARIGGVSATIVMPEDAPTTKIDRTRRYGAEVVTYDRYSESREEIAESLARQSGAVLVPPFDDRHVIAGQGTVGLEIVETMQRLGVAVDQVLVSCSGGGLASGIGIAVRETYPEAQIITVEPEGFDDVRRSLVAGNRLSNPPGGKSICDSLLVPTSGHITFPLLKSIEATGVAASDREALIAVRYAAEELKVITEPGGAIPLAAILSNKVKTKGRNTVAILSGGNVDKAVFDSAMRQST